MLSVVKMLLKGAVAGRSFNSHANYIVDGKPWENHGIVFLNLCGNPDQSTKQFGSGSGRTFCDPDPGPNC